MEIIAWALGGISHVLAGAMGLFSSSWVSTRMRPIPLIVLTLLSWTFHGSAFLTMAIVLASLGEIARLGSGRAARHYMISAYGLTPVILILFMRSIGAAPPWEAFAVMPIVAICVVVLALSSEIWLTCDRALWRWAARGYCWLIACMTLIALSVSDALIIIGALFFVVNTVLLGVTWQRPQTQLLGVLIHTNMVWTCYILAMMLFFLGDAWL